MSVSLPQHNTDTSGKFSLSQEDVDRLLSEKAPEIRVNIMHNIASGYEKSLYGERETEIAEQIFRMLVRDTEKNVRLGLVDCFKDSTEIPKDIIQKLVKDTEDEIAVPVMESSPLLSDRDLTAIIDGTPALSRLLAISRRGTVSELVSSALIEIGETTLISSLLENKGADIADSSYKIIIENNVNNEDVLVTMSERPYLPVAIAEQLISSVSDSLAAKLKEKYSLHGEESAEEIDRQVEKTREKATLRLLQELPANDEVYGMTMQLNTGGKLTPSLVFSALCHGHTTFFASAMANLAGIPVANTAKLIQDRGQLGFPALYARSNLPESLLPATSLVLRGVHQLESENLTPGTVEYADRLAAFVLAATESENIPKTSYMLALIRQNYME